MSDSQYVSIFPLLEAGKTVRLTPQGSSMVPFITGGRDQIELHKIEGNVKRGDIVLYRRSSGILVLHRVFKVKPEGLYMLGDGQTEVEGPVRREDLLAKCDVYYKKGRCKDNNSWAMKVKYNIWFCLKPVRMFLIIANSRLKGI